MGSVVIAIVSACCIFGGAVLGMWIKQRLPGHHLREESRDTIRVGAGMIATLAALVLGLLVGSGKGSFDATNTALTQISAKIVLLDRVLAQFGPETAPIRKHLLNGTLRQLTSIWPEEAVPENAVIDMERADGIESIQAQIETLVPQDDRQRHLLNQATQLGVDLAQAHWLLVEQEQTELPMPLLAVLVLWLSMLFMSWGLFAPRNSSVVLVLFLCAISVAAAIFLISEMVQPLDGTIKVSSAPVRKAISHLGH